MNALRCALLISLLCCLPAISFGAPAVAQAVSGTNSITIQNPGDTLIVIVAGQTGSGTTISGISSTPALTFTTDVTPFLMTYGAYGLYFPVAVWHATVATTGTYTISFSTNTLTAPVLFLVEASGVGSFDVAQASTSSYGTGTAAVTGSLTPGAANDLLLSTFTSTASGITLSGLTNGFTVQNTGSASGTSASIASLPDTATASIDSGATLSTSEHWAAYLVAFKASAGSTCTNKAAPWNGTTFVVPTAGTTVVRLQNGNPGTVDCSTVSYKQQQGVFGVN